MKILKITDLIPLSDLNNNCELSYAELIDFLKQQAQFTRKETIKECAKYIGKEFTQSGYGDLLPEFENNWYKDLITKTNNGKHN